MKDSLPTARGLLIALLVVAAAYGPVISALVANRALDMSSTSTTTCLWVLVFVVGSLAQLFAPGEPNRWRIGACGWASLVGPVVGVASFLVDRRSSSIATVAVPIALTTCFGPVVEEWRRGERIPSAIGAGAWVAFANLLALSIAVRPSASWIACMVGMCAGVALFLGAVVAGAAPRGGGPVLLRGLETAVWMALCASAAFAPWFLVGAVTFPLVILLQHYAFVVGGVIFVLVYWLLLRLASWARYGE